MLIKILISIGAILLAVSNICLNSVDAQPDKDGAESSKAAKLRESSDSPTPNSMPATISIPRSTSQSSRNIGHSLQTRSDGMQMQYGSSSPVSPMNPRPFIWSEDSSSADASRTETEVTEPLPKLLEEIMDLNIFPCDDFESFATGKYQFVNGWRTLRDINDEIDSLIMTPGESSSDVEDDSRIMSYNIRKFYQSCEQREGAIALNKERFLSMMAELGSCPLLQWEIGWDIRQGDSNFRFVNSMIRLFKMGLIGEQPISLDLLPDPDDPSRPILHIGQPIDEMTIVQVPRKFVFEKVKLLELNVPEVEVFEQIEEVYKFAKALSEVRRNERPKKVKLEEFAKKYPGIDWTHLVRELTGQSSNVHIMISNEDYLSLLEKLIHASNEGLIPNYIFMNMFERFGGFLDPKLDEGIGKINCLKIVNDEFTLPLSIEFKRSKDQTVLNEKLTRVNAMAESIRNQIGISLRRADWMTSGSRESALEKLSKMKFFIGLTSIQDEANFDEALALDQYGREPLSNESSFIDNYLIIREKIASFWLAELRKPTRNAAEWLDLELGASLRINYIERANAIQVPLGLLKAPFFDLNQPDYMNFASLGYLISRNVLKAFNLRGSRFNANGMNANELYDSATRHNYLVRLRTILGNTRVPFRVAVRSLSNDVLDLGASRMSMAAYELELKRNFSLDKSSKLANGKTLQPRQLFFVFLAANMACCNEQLLDGNIMDAGFHNPNRVNQILRYIRQFSDTFNCHMGTRMKPVDNVPMDIW